MAKSETPAKDVTIQGVVVSITQPYAEGHTVTAAEAKALNQVRAENIGNNMRARIKKALEEADGDVAAIQESVQADVSEYDANYEFTLASVGGGSTRMDPIEKEARKIANSLIMAKLREMGVTKKAYLEEHGEDALNIKVAEVAENENVIAAAKAALAERQKLGDVKLG